MRPVARDSRSARIENDVKLRTKVENAYRQSLRNVVREAERRVAGVDDPLQIQRILRDFMNSVQFEDMCGRAAHQMATTLAVGQQQSWREAAALSTRGREIFNALKREMDGYFGEVVRVTVIDNSRLIRSVPEDLARKLSQMANEGYQAGKRPEQIAEEMRKTIPEATNGRINLIARTETAKASTALVEARSVSLGIEWYTWKTAKDGDRVRESHRIMEGVLCRWSDPPSPESLAGMKSYGNYHPGCFPNCRCIALPVIALTDISFPATAHINGSLRQVKSPGELG